MQRRKLVSIITPVLNEEETVNEFYRRMKETTDALSDRYDFEFIFTDNASTDQTFALLGQLAAVDNRVRAFRFSRNFGYQKSIFTGYSKARGDCAVEFDCDLQDPPEMLFRFLEEWERGNKIVYGIRRTRQEGKLMIFLRALFYRMINRLSDHSLPEDAGDFMLIDRVVLDLLKHRRDQYPYLRGMIFSFGFNRIGIPYDRGVRKGGRSKFPTWRLIQLAIDGIISQSTVPLRIASYIGITVALLTMLMSGGYLLGWLFLGFGMVHGFTTTVLLMLFSIGLNALFLGIIGEYLLRIYARLHENHITIIADEIGTATPERLHIPAQPVSEAV